MPDFFNVFDTDYEHLDVEIFRGAGAQGRILHQSADRSHLVIASRYPNGVRYSGAGSFDYHEAFYIVHGSGSRTFPDGTSVKLTAGDLIWVVPGLEQSVVYDPGLMNVAFFWSTQGPLPDLTAGLSRCGLAE
jgi:mannose-6-phosphate isomerase-like protein (cupin superfamily)